MRRTLMGVLLAASMPGMAQVENHEGHAGHAMRMDGALGAYPMTREASGTSWQPEAVPMAGIHSMGDTWTLMLHGYADVVYDDQGGPRGDSKTFVPSMFMLMAQRPLGPGTFATRAMLSTDPLMGKDGYPLLLQTGETADGVTPLVDRQHPHDAFMELSTSYSLPVGECGSVFAYAGLPGEPALGPPAFMHRASGVVIPEAPLSHHWLDSTHVTFGVFTLGTSGAHWKLEASVFNGREPDEQRWNVETRKLDAYSGRFTVNPDPHWSAQVSYGYLPSPEQLEPEAALHRTTASVSYAAGARGELWSTTLAVGVNREEGKGHPAWLLETAREAGDWTLFARGEMVDNEHLAPSSPFAAADYLVGKLSVGASYELVRAGPLALRLGVLGSAYQLPNVLEQDYGSNPTSMMVFLRTSIE